LNNRNR